MTTAANDNKWDGRRVLAWPTAKRLVRSGRHDDLAMLVGYKRLADMAYGQAANDNYHNPAPAPGEEDDRGASEIIDELDRIMTANGIKPSIPEMQAASPPWPKDDGTAAPRPVVVATDKRNRRNVRRELVGESGRLAFIRGSELVEYTTTPTGQWQRPRLVISNHRNEKKSKPSLVGNSSGTWGLEDKIAARQELRLIHDAIPASSALTLELACGPTRAQEIGEAFRKRDKTAERFGVKVIDRALDQLREVWNPQNAFAA